MKILSTFLILIVISAEAKDFGIEGHTYPIAEEDILKVIERNLAKVDIEKLNRDMQDRTSKYIEKPPAVNGITRAKEDKVFYYDPTYTLQEDIKDHNGQVIHKSGIVNPLEYMPLSEDLIFIDGDNQSQVEMALNTKLSKKGKAKIILVKGSPLELQRKHKIWIYFDQAGFITSKLGITEIPAVVEQEKLKLRIRIIGEQHE